MGEWFLRILPENFLFSNSVFARIYRNFFLTVALNCIIRPHKKQTRTEVSGFICVW